MRCSLPVMRSAVMTISAEEILKMSQQDVILSVLIVMSVINLLLLWKVTLISFTVRRLLTRVYPSLALTTLHQTLSGPAAARLVLPSVAELSELSTVVLWLVTELRNLPSEKISNLLPKTRMELASLLQSLYYEIYAKPTISNIQSQSPEISSDRVKPTTTRFEGSPLS